MSEPQRVLGVMASLMGGGAERQMVLLLNNLDRARFSPMLCLLSRHGEFLDELASDVPVIGLGKQSPLDAPRLVGRLARVIRHEDPDVVLAKVDYANILTSLAAAVARTSPRLVLAEESVQSAALAGASYPWVRRTLLRWSYRRANGIVVPSPGVAEDLHVCVGIGTTPVEVIPNMIDSAQINAAAAAKAEHPFVDSRLPLVVAAGRLSRGKGQDDLLAAMALVAETQPCNLLLLGDGPERSRLESLANTLGLSSRVALMGFVSNPFALMANATLFVSPSHCESFGNVIVEAMAVGAPVLSTRVPAGPLWLIEDGVSGLFAEPGDPPDLARQIARALADPDLRARLTESARTTIRRFDVDTVTRSYEAMLGSGRISCVRAADDIHGDAADAI